MRRGLLALLTALFAALLLSFSLAPAAHAAPGTNGAAPVLAQSSSGESGSGSPSIIPSPNERGENNLGGLLVGVVLLGGWGLMGFLLFRQAKRRRAIGSPTAL